jgi:HAD superfamily hydrolase (TIGR01549 family)
MGTRAIVFDFGNVIGFFDHRRAAKQLAAYGDGGADVIQSFLFNGRLEDDYERGAIDSVAFRALVRERCRLACDDTQFDAAYADMFWPNPETCDLLPRLRERYRLLLLSNTTELHSRWFRRQFEEYLAHFHGLVLSHEIRARKPERRVYEHCVALAGCAASECLFVDDIAANVEGARACGLQGLVYWPGGEFVRRLSELGIH